MKRFTGFIAVCLVVLAAFGQMKISDYPATNNATSTDLLLLAVPGVTNRNITIANFRANVIGQLGTNPMNTATAYITNLYVTTNTMVTAYITNLYTTNITAITANITNAYVFNAYISNTFNHTAYVTTNIVNYSYVTNQYVVTNLVQISIITNLTVPQTNIVNQIITTNLTVINTNNSFYTITTNLYVSETNIVNYTITTNLWVTQTNIVNQEITTNLTVINNITAKTAYITNIVTEDVMRTNRTITLPTNTTTATLDFLSSKDWYEVPNLMETNINLGPTNLMAGREVWVFFTAANCNYDVAVTNTAGTAIHWNFNGPTNGSTAFTVTNGYNAELCLTVRSNNILHAVYGQYR